jgi:hypothetical protein
MTLSEQMRQLSQAAWEVSARKEVMSCIWERIEEFADRGDYKARMELEPNILKYAKEIEAVLKEGGFEVKEWYPYSDRDELGGFFVKWHQPQGKEARMMHAKSSIRRESIIDHLYEDILNCIKSEALKGKSEATYKFKDSYILVDIEKAVMDKLASEGFVTPKYLGCAWYAERPVTISW